MRFRATIELAGKSATGVRVPPDFADAPDQDPEARRIAAAVADLREGRTQL